MMRAKEIRIAVRKFGPFESAIQKQWDSFESRRQSGMALSLVSLDLHPLMEQFFEKDGLRNGTLDIAFLNLDWTLSVHEAGSVLNLLPLIEADPPAGFPNAWAPSLLQLQNIDGFIVGLPYHNGPECLIYRKDLFDDPENRGEYRRRHAADLKPPETWEEFHRIAKFFERPERNLYGTCFAAFPDGHNTVYDFLLQLWTRGGEILRDGRLCINTPEAAEALRFYRAMLTDSSAVHPKCRDMDSVGSGKAFAQGEVAMMVNWFGFAAVAEAGDDSRVRGQVRIASVPRGKNGASLSLNTYWLLSIAAGSPHPEIAYEFLRHCATPEMDRLLTLEGGIGCRRSTWTDEEVNRRIPFYKNLEMLHSVAREMPQLPQWPRASAIIDKAVTRTLDGDRPIEALLLEAEEELQRLNM